MQPKRTLGGFEVYLVEVNGRGFGEIFVVFGQMLIVVVAAQDSDTEPI